MLRHSALLLGMLLIVGCVPDHSDPPLNPPSKAANTPAAQTQPTDPPTEVVKPEKKADPEPAQTFTPPEDKELTALKEVPTDDLIARLGDEKQRELATRALISRGADAADPLIKALEAKEAQTRAAAAFALGQLGKQAASATDALKNMAESDESEIGRDAATFALDAIEGK